jgi:glycosyltransferase involved in cell wall biosynthesis
VVEDFSFILDMAVKIRADVIWLGFGNISYPLLKFLKQRSTLPVVLDTDSVWSRFISRELEYASSEEARVRIKQLSSEKAEEERWGTAEADVTTAVSEIDAEYYRALAKHPSQIEVFPNVIDIDSYRSCPPPAPGMKSPSLILAGTFFGVNSPMGDSAVWTIEHVLPLLKQRVPNIHLYIVGSGSEILADAADDAVTVTGGVESVLPYLCHSVVALVPLRFESGTRFKILEAGACGIPVVSTTLGAEGLPVKHRHNILIADDPRAFATSIIELIENPQLANRLGKNLKTFVEMDYGIDTLAQASRRILDHVLERKSQAG